MISLEARVLPDLAVSALRAGAGLGLPAVPAPGSAEARALKVGPKGRLFSAAGVAVEKGCVATLTREERTRIISGRGQAPWRDEVPGPGPIAASRARVRDYWKRGAGTEPKTRFDDNAVSTDRQPAIGERTRAWTHNLAIREAVPVRRSGAA